MSSAKATAAAPTYSEGQQDSLSQDLAGNLRVTVAAGGGIVVVVGDNTPSDAYANPTDAVDAWALKGLWDNTAGSWRRARCFLTDLAVIPSNTHRAELIAGIGYAYNLNATGFYPNTAQADGDAQANANFVLNVFGRNYLYNGATWDRQRAVAAGDAVANPSIAAVSAAFLQGYDNTAGTWKRGRVDASGYLRNVASPPANADTETAQFYSDGGTSGMVGVARAARAKALAVDARCAITLGGWFQLFNKATNPANGDAAVMQFHVAVNSEGIVSVDRGFFGETGQLFTTGLAYAFSSTADTLTIAADSPWSVAVSYV